MMDLTTNREKLREVGRDWEYLYFIHQVTQNTRADELQHLIQQLGGQLPKDLQPAAEKLSRDHIQWMSQLIHQRGFQDLRDISFTDIMERLENRAWEQLVMRHAQQEGEAIFTIVRVAILQFALWIRQNLEEGLEELERQQRQTDDQSLQELTGPRGSEDNGQADKAEKKGVMFPGQAPLEA